MACQLAEKVRVTIGLTLRWGLIGDAAVAVFQSLAQSHHLSRSIASPEPNRTVQDIVCMQDERAFAVTLFQASAHRVQDGASKAGVDALNPQRVPGKVEDMLEGDAPESICNSEHVALNVIGEDGVVLFNRRPSSICLACAVT